MTPTRKPDPRTPDERVDDRIIDYEHWRRATWEIEHEQHKERMAAHADWVAWQKRNRWLAFARCAIVLAALTISTWIVCSEIRGAAQTIVDNLFVTFNRAKAAQGQSNAQPEPR